ncbi:MAG: peptide-methionine (R)-S-oxide reductase MsrB [Eggerthellaceae bacterium]|nr:peptide-methionine (R)-S-oxide reductase MsrB [Eggerthellaceae bacterium]
MYEKPSKKELKHSLTRMQYRVTQRGGTEMAFTGKLLDNGRHGTYNCVVCGAPLFSWETKFESGTGWPSFYRPVNKDAIDYVKEGFLGLHNVEVRCKRCGAHLGHVFPDGPKPTGDRYCINSAALSFTDDETGEETRG